MHRQDIHNNTHRSAFCKLYNDGLKIKSGHLLSPKDRDVSDYLSRLIESGVASLKLEGRMRDENYVRSAVRAYRTLIDAYYYGYLDDALIREVRRDLLINFNRGGSYTAQYLSGRKDDNLLSGEYPGKYGYNIGKISRLDVKKGTVTVSLARNAVIPSKGDYISVRNDRAELCSFPVGKLHEMPHEIAVKGLHPDMIRKLTPGLAVFIMNHSTEQDRSDFRRTPVRFNLYFNDSDVTLDATVISGPNADILLHQPLLSLPILRGLLWTKTGSGHSSRKHSTHRSPLMRSTSTVRTGHAP